MGYIPSIVVFCGNPFSGKTQAAKEFASLLGEKGHSVALLDKDAIVEPISEWARQSFDKIMLLAQSECTAQHDQFKAIYAQFRGQDRVLRTESLFRAAVTNANIGTTSVITIPLEREDMEWRKQLESRMAAFLTTNVATHFVWLTCSDEERTRRLAAYAAAADDADPYKANYTNREKFLENIRSTAATGPGCQDIIIDTTEKTPPAAADEVYLRFYEQNPIIRPAFDPEAVRNLNDYYWRAGSGLDRGLAIDYTRLLAAPRA
jgi:Chromatin associated protein KTI12